MDPSVVQTTLVDIVRIIGIVVAAGGAVYGTFGGIELGAALKGRDGSSQRDGAMQLLGGVAVAACGGVLIAISSAISIV